MGITADNISDERLKGALILVVDDMVVNRKMLCHSLKAHGYARLAEAEDGAQALQMTHDIKPDLVILDLMMPVMDGFPIARRCGGKPPSTTRRLSCRRRFPKMEQKLRAFELGASDYICKPIDPGELNARSKCIWRRKC